MQTCAILEPEKESTSKEERPMKKVLILSGSPRKDGNSDLLCSEFMRGAQESGNEVQKIFVRSKKIVPCNACYYCRDHGGKCALNDDMSEILDAMQAADVIVMASPVYFYPIVLLSKTQCTIRYCLDSVSLNFKCIISFCFIGCQDVSFLLWSNCGQMTPTNDFSPPAKLHRAISIFINRSCAFCLHELSIRRICQPCQ